ncbi:hypothetical protein [Glutamicibacter halophytocola]|uniref:DUF333 domain-containing protein n=1 Tax=Glutamicibacter halophytocola TaxID=1933880 RepID=A0AA94XUC3_9MICC|nr:hypothetical protein [Glutamicibacter halophytocola]UUX60154.1 hypothetical protein NUH22_05960 [Glutamicibacter halophytocola]
MKKKLTALALVAVALTGCANGNPDPATGEPGSLYEENVTLRDGRELTCIVYARGYKGGVSCDWEGIDK